MTLANCVRLYNHYKETKQEENAQVMKNRILMKGGSIPKEEVEEVESKSKKVK